MITDFKEGVIDAIRKTIEQGEASLLEGNNSCAYRGVEGRKCTVGHMIDDKFYSTDMEDNSADDGIIINALREQYTCITGDDIDVLTHLQATHDAYANSRNFIEDFEASIRVKVKADRLPEYCLEGLEPIKTKEDK